MKFLFYKEGALGDIVVLTPLFFSLKQSYKDCEITFITNETGYSNFLKEVGVIDVLMNASDGDIYKIHREKGRSSDIENVLFWIDFSFFITNKENLYCNNAGNFQVKPLPTKSKNISFYYIEEVYKRLHGKASFDSWDCFRKVFLRETKRAIVKRVNFEKPYITFHPGSGSMKKNLQPRHFLDVINSVGESDEYKKILILGPVETELFSKNDIHLLQEAVEGTIVSPDIDVLLAVLANSAVYFGMDSGATHIANMVAGKTISFWNASEPAIWSPNSSCVKKLVLTGEHFIE